MQNSSRHTHRSALIKDRELRLRDVSKNRNLFRPVQPAVTDNDELVTYNEVVPAAPLQPYIYCYWQLKTSQRLENPFSYRVVADGCVDIAFDMRNTRESLAMGFHDTYNEFDLESEFNYVGIRLLPAMFPLTFGIDASGLCNCVLPLEDVLPMIARFIRNHVDPEYTIDQVTDLLNQYFIRELVVRHDIDNRFFNALKHILTTHGVLHIGSDIDTGLSTRQMRRLFNFYVGDSPKSFAKVVRFQNIIQGKPSRQSLQQNKLFHEGYYDQAHFIKEFRTLYGVTPSKVFK